MGKSSPARFQITLAQTAHVRFRSRKRVHTRLRQQDRTQRLTERNRGVSDGGRYHYPRSVLRGSETLRGRVAERQTLPLLGLGRVCSRRAQRACGTATRSCASLFRGVAAPLGCVIPLFFSLTTLMSFTVLLNRFVGTQKIERLFFSYSGAFLEQKA